MAAKAAAMRAAGATIIGGCCGTTPGHLAEMAARLAGDADESINAVG
jgi:methionine synthase I (cobalamin-dependent)